MGLPFQQRGARRHRQLASMLVAAGQNVPYYRDLFRTLRFNPQSVQRDLRYLEDLPYLTKDTIREQDGRMLSERYRARYCTSARPAARRGPARSSTILRPRLTGRPP